MSIVIAILMTLLVTKIQDPADVDPQLLAPFIRRFVSNRKYPNQPRDGIIYAYEVHVKYLRNLKANSLIILDYNCDY